MIITIVVFSYGRKQIVESRKSSVYFLISLNFILHYYYSSKNIIKDTPYTVAGSTPCSVLPWKIILGDQSRKIVYYYHLN